ncbi:hypothetical protein GQ55_2G217200 [Panicum hallii var. hallii]|uniref:Uncharacterized protein n=1 Tax=Panicum hallii var. hallii TaxID=1504633 RepID=A0A2T7ER43_9POAL|nr:hypothetical protein GQ55_2G217200 [Panicum hallii var. hallii]
MIVASRTLEYHVEKELGRLFWQERKNTQMYGEKELKKYWIQSKLCLNLQMSPSSMHEEWINSNGGVRWGLLSLVCASQYKLIHLDFMRQGRCP